MPKMKVIQKVVQKLLREQESAAGAGGGVRTGTPGWLKINFNDVQDNAVSAQETPFCRKMETKFLV